MQSPLQVTIMAALVSGKGQPPEDRWSLFQAYYRTIYEREMARDIPAAQILLAHRSDVDAIHQRVALLLQVRSEHAQQTDARLSHEQLSAVIERRLAEQGHEEPRRSALRDRIIEAAADRLVFLVGLRHDSVGFELRSLQEHMAAECLVAGEREEVAGRLSAIAGLASWRNVTLFAMGHCFARREGLRDTLLRICTDLSTSEADPLARSRLVGAALALDVLLDGAVRSQPIYERLLAEEAARLLHAVGPVGQGRLEEAWDDEIDGRLRAAVEHAIAGRRVCAALEGWRVLLTLETRGVPWAAELIAKRWPADPREAMALLPSNDDARHFGTTASLRFADALALQPPAMERRAERLIVRVDAPEPRPPWSGRIRGSLGEDGDEVLLLEPELGRLLTVMVSPLPSPLRSPLVLPFETEGIDPGWIPVAAAGRFGEDPSADALAAALRTIADGCESAQWRECRAVLSPAVADRRMSRLRARSPAVARARRHGDRRAARRPCRVGGCRTPLERPRRDARRSAPHGCARGCSV